MTNHYRPTKIAALLASVLYAAHKSWAISDAGRIYNHEGFKSLYTTATALIFQD